MATREWIQWNDKGGKDGGAHVVLSGSWALADLTAEYGALVLVLETLAKQGRKMSLTWDLSAIERIDSAGAWLLWRAWGCRWPAEIVVPDEHRRVVDRLAASRVEPAPAKRLSPAEAIEQVGDVVLGGFKHLGGMVALIGQMVLDLGYLCAHPRDIPWREFSASLYKSGAQALPVTALVGFLIGVVLSYLSSLQLKTFGADIFIINLIGISVIRELGPVIVAVLVAGRSGSAMTAQIGVMRVTEEIDALATMGVSRSLRLVLPKMLALGVAMPLLVVWCSAAGILGGMVSANLEMGLGYAFFFESLPRAVPVANLLIGIGKGVAFGLLIGLIACHFGLKVRPNTESLSARTTSSVVTAITVVIIVDALVAILTRGVGMPL